MPENKTDIVSPRVDRSRLIPDPEPIKPIDVGSRLQEIMPEPLIKNKKPEPHINRLIIPISNDPKLDRK